MNRRHVVAAVALVALAGCASKKVRPDVVWPDPPEKARIKFVTAIRSQQDLREDGWSKVGRFVSGGGEESLMHPMGLAVSDDGNRLYIADLRGSMVFVADFVARTLKPFQPLGTFQHPCNVALDAEENVYVTDAKAARVIVFTKGGNRLRAFAGETERPTGIAIDRARGLAYVADTSRTRSQNHRVLAYTLEGQLVREVGRGRGSEEQQFNFPSYLALDAEGNLYVNDAMNFRIQVFDPEGRFVRAYGEQGMRPGQFSRTKGLDFDGFGNLYVADGEHSVVQMFNKNFDQLMFFGGRISRLEYFDIPSAIAIDRKRNRIYVANEILARVNVYDLVNTTADESLPAAAEQKPAQSDASAASSSAIAKP